MDFRFDEEQVALRDAIRAFCEQHFALDAVASREDQPTTPATWQVLSDMGIFATLRSRADGGATAAAIAFEQFGASLATGPLLWSTLAGALLPDAASGAVRVTGIDAAAGAPYVVEHALESDVVLLVQDDDVRSFPTAALPDPLPGEPFDPLTPVLAYAELPDGQTLGGAGEARRVRLAGTVLAAAQLVGVAQGALDVATAYALDRHQFGVPIGSFQAIKHMLADMYVRVELARSAMSAAAAIVDDERAGDAATAASTAKLLAGEAGIANGRTAVQVLGGMGFTWEMPPNYFLKRAWVLEQSFGTADTHALALSAAPETAWT
jgi:alkylation response protein AidB-like acyl-CoA dehydrogenase